jgi:hypothetical protein
MASGPTHQELQDAFTGSPLYQEMLEVISGRRPLEDSRAKRQHFIPQFLLRHFAGPDEARLAQLETSSGRPCLVTVHEAASRRNFYRVVSKDGTRHNRVEAGLARVEHHAAPVIQKLFTGFTDVTAADQATLSHFLALLDGRTPSGAQRAAHSADTSMRMLLTDTVADSDAFAEQHTSVFPDATPDELEALRQRTLRGLSDGSIAYPDERALGVQTTFQSAGAAAQLIFQLHWTLLLADEGEFVTSDAGLAMIDPTPIYPWSGTGLTSSPGAETTIPLGRKTCLMLTPTDPIAGRRIMEVSRKRVDEINLRTYGWAERFIFGSGQEAVTRVHKHAKQQPRLVARPRPTQHVLLFEADPNDRELAREHERRGWPPRLPSDGEMCDYVVFDAEENPIEQSIAAHALARRRAARRLGIDQLPRSSFRLIPREPPPASR